MESSQFNVLVPYEDKILLYNTLSRSLLALDQPDEQKQVVSALEYPYGNPENRYINILTENGFIVASKAEELEHLALMNRLSRFQTATLNLQVTMTLNCNLRCPYCFEEQRNERLTQDARNKILKFLSRKIPNLEYLTIEWFGGEPLLAINDIVALNLKIKDLCTKHRCEYVPSITTNGVLLNQKRVAQLVEGGINVAQITLDGPAKAHDNRRVGINKSPTFERIVENIDIALQNGMTISVRINVDKDNVGSMEELLHNLKDRGLHREISYYFKRVFPPGTSRVYDDLPLSVDEYAEAVLNLRRTARKMGFSKVSMISYDHSQTCVAESINQYQVSPTGELYKCAEVFKPFERVGMIDEYGGEMLEERYFQWMSKDVFSDSECSRCKVLPLCWGGCQAAKFKYGQKECSEIRYTLRDFIIEEYESSNLNEDGESK